MGSRDFCHSSTDRGSMKWMDRLGIRFDLAIVIPVDALTLTCACACESQHTACLLSSLCSFFPPSPPFRRLFAAAGEHDVNSGRASWDGGGLGSRVIIGQNMACSRAVDPKLCVRRWNRNVLSRCLKALNAETSR
jgi:hypothetical protein